MPDKQPKINIFFSLSTRFFTAFFILLFLFVSIQLYNIIQLKTTVEELQTLNNFHLKFLFQTYEFENKHNLLLQFLKTLKSEELQTKKNPVLLRKWLNLNFENRMKYYFKLKKTYTSQFNKLSDKEKGFSKNNIQTLMTSIFTKLNEDKKRFSNILTSNEKFKNINFKSLYRREQLIMSSIKHLIHISKSRVRKISGQLAQTEQTQLKQQLILIIGAILLSVIIILLSGKPLKNLANLTTGAKKIGKGEFSHRIIVASNDEIGVLSKEFNSMAEAIEERERRLLRTERLATAGKLTAQIAHEIRNPLAAVSFQTELLYDLISDSNTNEQLKKDLLEIVSSLQNEVERLVVFTNESLNFARLPEPKIKKHNVFDFLNELKDSVIVDSIVSGCDITLHIPSNVDFAYFDVDLMRQVLINLLKNASEAMPDGGNIDIFVTKKHNKLILKVSDEGIGISDENKNKIFEAFYTDKKNGTGLGLALSMEIINEHKGTLRVKNKNNQGAVFIIELPLKPSIESSNEYA